MELPFNSFPYNQNIWIISINQIQMFTLEKSIVFSGQISDRINATGYDFTKVTDLIIATGVNELNAFGDHTEYLQKTIINCHDKFPNLKNIYILYTTVYFERDRLFSKCPLTIIHIPYFLLRSTMTDLSQFTEWTPNNKKAIFLIGDIRNRIHKFPLLYYFLDKEHLNLLDYSLHNDHYGTNYFDNLHVGSVITQINDCFNTSFDLFSFEKLYKSLVKYFPGDEGFIKRETPLTGLSLYTHYYPPNWNSAACNLVVETTFFPLKKTLGIDKLNGQDDFFFSEKMWKPILSGKPFIAFSEYDAMYLQLEKMGFKTFLNYTSIPKKIDEPQIDPWLIPLMQKDIQKTHLQVCHDRTVSFLNNIEKHKDAIISDINFNVTRWKEISKNAWEDLYTRCPPIKNISNIEFCEMFNNHACDLTLYNNWMEK